MEVPSRPCSFSLICGKKRAFCDNNFGGSNVRMHQSRTQLRVTGVCHMNMFMNVGDLGSPRSECF